jgi:hypothetical protein
VGAKDGTPPIAVVPAVDWASSSDTFLPGFTELAEKYDLGGGAAAAAEIAAALALAPLAAAGAGGGAAGDDDSPTWSPTFAALLARFGSAEVRAALALAEAASPPVDSTLAEWAAHWRARDAADEYVAAFFCGTGAAAPHAPRAPRAAASWAPFPPGSGAQLLRVTRAQAANGNVSMPVARAQALFGARGNEPVALIDTATGAEFEVQHRLHWRGPHPSQPSGVSFYGLLPVLAALGAEEHDILEFCRVAEGEGGARCAGTVRVARWPRASAEGADFHAHAGAARGEPLPPAEAPPPGAAAAAAAPAAPAAACGGGEGCSALPGGRARDAGMAPAEPADLAAAPSAAGGGSPLGNADDWILSSDDDEAAALARALRRAPVAAAAGVLAVALPPAAGLLALEARLARAREAAAAAAAREHEREAAEVEAALRLEASAAAALRFGGDGGAVAHEAARSAKENGVGERAGTPAPAPGGPVRGPAPPAVHPARGAAEASSLAVTEARRRAGCVGAWIRANRPEGLLVNTERWKAAVLVHVADQPGAPPTDKAIRRSLGDQRKVSDALRALTDAGVLARSGAGGRTSPFSYTLEAAGHAELPAARVRLAADGEARRAMEEAMPEWLRPRTAEEAEAAEAAAHEREREAAAAREGEAAAAREREREAPVAALARFVGDGAAAHEAARAASGHAFVFVPFHVPAGALTAGRERAAERARQLDANFGTFDPADARRVRPALVRQLAWDGRFDAALAAELPKLPERMHGFSSVYVVKGGDRAYCGSDLVFGDPPPAGAANNKRLGMHKSMMKNSLLGAHYAQGDNYVILAAAPDTEGRVVFTGVSPVAARGLELALIDEGFFQKKHGAGNLNTQLGDETLHGQETAHEWARDFIRRFLAAGAAGAV